MKNIDILVEINTFSCKNEEQIKKLTRLKADFSRVLIKLTTLIKKCLTF